MSVTTDQTARVQSRHGLPARTAFTDIQAAFEEVAQLVREPWISAGHREDALPEIAVEALRRASLPSRIKPADLLDYILLQDNLPDPVAGENEFGNPALTVVRDARFRVELIVWRAGVANLHGHYTGGAFQPLFGRRLQSEYVFERPVAVGQGLEVGEYRRVRTVCLSPGDVLPVLASYQLLHDLVYLDPLCLTLTVRGHPDRVDFRKCVEVPPHVRLDVDAPVFRHKALTDTWARCAARQSPEHIRGLLRSSPTKAFTLLEVLVRLLPQSAFDDVVAEAAALHGPVVQPLAASVRERVRREVLAGAISQAPTYESRLLLGLAFTSLDADEARCVAAQAAPGADPVRLMADGLAAVRTAFGNRLDDLASFLRSDAAPYRDS